MTAAVIAVPPPPPRSKADWVRQYFAAGWRAFPVIENDKRPARMGWQNAAEVETLAALTEQPCANLGAGLPDGCFALDVDGEVGRAVLEAFEIEHGPLPATLEAQTRSGGRHLVFSLPPGATLPNAVKFAPGLDVRMAGKGFIVVEPSTINGRAYRWLNWGTPIAAASDWLVQAVRTGKQAADKPKADASTGTASGSPIPEGMRNDTLAGMAGAMRKAGFSQEAIGTALALANEERCDPPLPPEEIATIAASMARYPAAIEPWDAFGRATLPTAATAIPPRRFRLLTAAELSALPPISWRVRGVIPADGIGALYGPSGSGKSFLALDLLAAIARGGQWFGCRVKAAPVVYVALEGEAGISNRVQAYQAEHGPLPDAFRFLLTALDLRDGTDRAELVKAIKATGQTGGVLVLATLNRAAPGMDENDSRDMGEVISAAKAMQAELSGLVLLVHHTGKDGTKGMRGHSSLHAALDAAIEVRRDGDSREWSIAKAKDGQDGEGHPFRLHVVEIGTDDGGEAITSCIVVPDQKAAEATKRRIPKGGNQRIVWDALGELLRESKHSGKGGAPITRPCVELETAIAAIASRLLCDDKRKQERTRQAITGLVSTKAIEHREGWIWIP